MMHLSDTFLSLNSTESAVAFGWEYLDVFGNRRPSHSKFVSVKVIALELSDGGDSVLLDWIESRMQEFSSPECLFSRDGMHFTAGSQCALPSIGLPQIAQTINLECPTQHLESMVWIP